MEENPLWKKILYGRKSFMEENPIWKNILYGRKSYMEENPIWKKILYGRKSKIDKKVLSAVLFIHKIYLFISIVVNNVVS